MIGFITGQAGSGKTSLLIDKIKNCSDPGKKQLVIVPEQFSYEFDKRLYFMIGAERFNSLLSLTFTSLSRQLFQIFGESERKGEYADDLARMIMIYQAVAAVRDSAQMTYFNRQADSGEFAAEILKLINDMKRSGIDPLTLSSQADLLEGRLVSKTHDIAAVYLEYERLMKEYGFRDNLENIRLAARTAALHEWFRGMDIYIDEFESFTGDQFEMLRVMISMADNVYIALRTDDVTAGQYTLFETVNDTFRSLVQICREAHKEHTMISCGESKRFASPDLAYLSSHIMRSFMYEPEAAPSPENIHVLEAKDMYGETEYVCATIRRLICSDKSLRFSDIAVISNNIADYSEILKAAFSRYDIPYFMSLEKPVSHTPIMVFFTTLLDMLCAKKIKTDQVLRFLRCGIIDIPLTDVSALENYCFKWNIDGDMWKKPFTAEDDSLELAESLRVYVTEPLSALKKKLAAGLPADEVCRLLYECLIGFDAEKNTAALMVKLIEADRDYDASELKRLWGCLIDILDSISATLGSRVIPFKELAMMMRAMTSRIEYSVPPQTLDSVIAASAMTARLSEPKIVFVMGACDGDFPNHVDPHGLFSEADKQMLSRCGIDISRPVSELIAAERLIVYKSFSYASQKLYVSYPLSDLSGQAKYPSQVIDSILKMFGRDDMLITEESLSPDYFAVTMHSAFYHYMQNRADNTPVTASIASILSEDMIYKSRIARILTRSEYSQDFTVDRETMEKLIDFHNIFISPSSLEEHSQCSFKYFCDHVLKLKAPERAELDARVSGDIIHSCFNRILGEGNKETFLSLTYPQISDMIRRCAEDYRNEKLAGDFGKDPRFELTFNKLTERLPEVFMYTQHSLMESDFVPVDFEAKIEKEHSVRIKYGKDSFISFGGIIDRVDTCEIKGEKYIRIIDYKSSPKDINVNTLGSGTNMQMLLYLFAATEPNGIYSGYVPAGVLYAPVQIKKVEADNSKEYSLNESALRSAFRTNGLVIDSYNVLNAMEKGVGGKYIPVKLDSSGEPDKYSKCISRRNMEKLRDFSYRKLIDMAESLHSGKVPAVPLKMNSYLPCTYCDYANICGNPDGDISRTPDAESVAEASVLISNEKEDFIE